MKAIQIAFCFYPDSVGGTEVYVESLTAHLQQRGIEVLVTAPTEENISLAYSHNGIKVRRFPVSKDVADLSELYGEGNIQAAKAFGEILDEEKPDLVHLHAFTRGASLRLVREAKKRDIPVVFTYHTPTVSCQRGALMRWGKEVCDGILDLDTCTRCTLHGLGLSLRVTNLVGRTPVSAGKALGVIRLSGGLWTALRMRELVQTRHAAFHTFMAEVDHVVAVCEWVRDVLLRNGVPERKITVSRQGLPQVPFSDGEERETLPVDHIPLRIAYLGRLDPTKGPDILIRALRVLPDARIKLDLYGIVQGAGGESYLRKLKELARDDPRIDFFPPVPNDKVLSLLRQYHLLAVPSQCLETGPLVVLEAFAAGIPVIGSNLGGVAELVKHEVNGLLVEPDSAEAWSRTLQRASEDRGLLLRLRAGIRPPRGMEEVAEEMGEIYTRLNQRTIRRGDVLKFQRVVT